MNSDITEDSKIIEADPTTTTDTKKETKHKLPEDQDDQDFQSGSKRPRKRQGVVNTHDNGVDPYLLDMPTQISFRIENGIRYLTPYWSYYLSRTKGRWVGREVAEVFRTEFLSYNPNYSMAALRLGRILINNVQVTDPTHKLRNNDVIMHIHHKHEHPVLDTPIKVIADTPNMFVINKPPSLPIHACGQYKVNTILGHLWKLYGITGLRVLHRLDRTTSGVLMFAKDVETDVEIKKLILSGQWKKEYVCKVGGHFPDGKQVCEAPIDPLVISLGIQCVREEGKKCRSTFQRIWYDPVKDESLVLCNIETGRTHQIRVHLQYLGFPILGDSFYNTDAWGPHRGKGAQYEKSLEQLVFDVRQRHSCTHWHEEKDPEYEGRLLKIAEGIEEIEREEWSAKDFKFDQRPDYDPICLSCNVVKRKPPPEHFWIPLHCWRYQSTKWSYTAELPEWALPPEGAQIEPDILDSHPDSTSQQFLLEPIKATGTS